jgi:hypothetical protein
LLRWLLRDDAQALPLEQLEELEAARLQVSPSSVADQQRLKCLFAVAWLAAHS